MSAKLFLLLLFLPFTAAAQGYRGLGTSAEGYQPVTPPADLAFPRDHGAHDGFRIEWWYLTANLTGTDGADYGAQWTLFRLALAPGPDKAGPNWTSNVVWMGHAAATSAEAHRYAATYARGGIGQAGVTQAPFRAWIDGWDLAGSDDLADITISAAGDGFAYRLHATTDRPPVPQGDAGYSVKSSAGQASYYYSQPFYRVEGEMTLDGRTQAVTGQAWLDREWSSQPMAPDQQGWDWFALHLDDGARLMAYRFRTGAKAELAGTWIAADGTPTPLGPGALQVTPLREAEVAGRTLPIAWRIEVPSHRLVIDTEPVNASAWLATDFPYWEGPIRFTGSRSGRGYLEMTGYD